MNIYKVHLRFALNASLTIWSSTINFYLSSWYWFSQDHTHVAVVGVGKSHSAEDSFSSLEDIDIRRQNIRSAAAGIISVYPRDFICYSFVRYYYCLCVCLLPLHWLYNWVLNWSDFIPQERVVQSGNRILCTPLRTTRGKQNELRQKDKSK